MQAQVAYTGEAINEKKIYTITLIHTSGTVATITNYGATLMQFSIINAHNISQNIVLGFDAVQAYRSPAYKAAYPYFGAIIGRTANRIKNAQFTLDNTVYQLAPNLDNDNLHGGSIGFDSMVWHILDHGSTPNPYVTLQHISPHLTEGYPGTLTTTVTYTLLHNELQYEITAHTTQATLANMTNHTYFNLNTNNDTIHNHIVQLNALTYLEQDDANNPTGHVLPVTNTYLDFTAPHTVSSRWNNAQGYDHSYVVHNYNGALQQVATCTIPNQNIILYIYTTEPIVHLYTGRWIPEVIGINENAYGAFSGLCFETQAHPNGINIPNFPSSILLPNEQYYQKNSYKITCNT